MSQIKPLTLKRLGRGQITPLTLKGWGEATLTAFIMISHVFPENFIEVPQVVQEIRRFSSSILTVFINFFGFFDIFLL